MIRAHARHKLWERRPRRDIGGCYRGVDAAPTVVFMDPRFRGDDE